MSEQHTQGLLTLSRLGNVTGGPVRTYAGGPGQDQIFMVCSLDSDNGDKEANARRVVACWNACNGLHTESLERGKPLADQIVDALNQRDELIEALKLFVKYEAAMDDRDDVSGMMIYHEFSQKANAIAEEYAIKYIATCAQSIRAIG